MDDKKPKNFVELFGRGLKETFLDIKDKDVEQAVSDLLDRAKIKNFDEFIRVYKFRNYGDLHKYDKENIYSKFYHRKFKFKQVGELLGHSGQIDRICFDNSSEFFFTASTDGMIKMWSITTGFLVHSFIAHRSLVNDLCFSKDGKLMVSCDFFGQLNIWSLETKEVLINLQFHIGVDFTEFFSCEKDEDLVYNLVVILSTGLLRTYKFNKEKILEIQENEIHANEIVKAICITDGGRFLLRGGYWPYLIVLDTLRPKECIIFDTDGLSVHTLCASKDSLKFAAACANYLYQWTFFVDGSPSYGNFNKTIKDLRGYWSKTVTQVDPSETFNIERMCYLKDNYIVCVCSDFKIRLYAGSILTAQFEVEELGMVCPHPLENVFALCGSSIKFYYLDRLVDTIRINFNVTDCQFSNDGLFFIVGDDFGKARVFGLTGEQYKLNEQFFPSDFDHINSLNESINMPCDLSKTIDSNRNINLGWAGTNYKICKISNKHNFTTEGLGFRHLEKNFIDKEKYNKKYGILTISESNAQEEEEISSISDSNEFSDEEYDESESESEEKGLGIRLRRTVATPFVRRRIVIDEESSEETSLIVKKLRRNRPTEEPPKPIRSPRFFNKRVDMSSDESSLSSDSSEASSEEFTSKLRRNKNANRFPSLRKHQRGD